MSKKSRFRGPFPWRSNMVNGLKDCSKLNDSTFNAFINLCEGNWCWKSFCERYAKPWDCLLNHWLRMTSIPFLPEAIYCNIFRRIYLRNKKYFLDFLFFFFFFLAFSKFRLNFEHFQTKMTLLADVFLDFQTPKNVVR